MKILLFDTETTDLRPGQIGQLSYIIIDMNINKLFGKNFFFSVDSVNPSASNITGLTKEKLDLLSGGKLFKDNVEEIFMDFINADLIVAHNIDFDMKFIKAEFSRCGIDFNPKLCFCSMKYYTQICKIPSFYNKVDYKFPRLEEAINFVGVEESRVKDLCSKLYKETSIDFHDSRYDIVSTYLLIKEGINKGYMPKGFLTDSIKLSQE